MQKNQIFTAEITGCTSQGLGVARFEDRAVFVKGAIPARFAASSSLKLQKPPSMGG